VLAALVGCVAGALAGLLKESGDRVGITSSPPGRRKVQALLYAPTGVRETDEIRSRLGADWIAEGGSGADETGE
jgi:hypothetical protein